MNNESIKISNYIFDNEQITNLVSYAKQSFETHERNYIQFYYSIYKLREFCKQNTPDENSEWLKYIAVDVDGVVVERGNKFSFNSLIKTLFNIDRTQLSRGLNVLARFSNLEDVEDNKASDIEVKQNYTGFSDTKLQELLPYEPAVVDDMIEKGKIKASCTVRELRSILKDKPQKAPLPEPEPFNLNRAKPYTLDEFRLFNRNDLVMIAYETYEHYLRLKRQMNELKDKSKKG